jgi:uncharacterized protein with GYD domain
MLFAMLTRLTPDAVPTPHAIQELERHAMKRIRSECPDAKWIHSYSALGRYDYLDIFEAPDVDTAAKVAVLIRSYGHAHAEILPIMEWEHFKTLLPTKRAPERETPRPGALGPEPQRAARADYGEERRVSDVAEHDYGAIGHEPAEEPIDARINE